MSETIIPHSKVCKYLERRSLKNWYLYSIAKLVGETPPAMIVADRLRSFLFSSVILGTSTLFLAQPQLLFLSSFLYSMLNYFLLLSRAISSLNLSKLGPPVGTKIPLLDSLTSLRSSCCLRSTSTMNWEVN